MPIAAKYAVFPFLLYGVPLPWLSGSAAQQLAPWPTDQWAVDSPANRGLDAATLRDLTDRVRDGSFRNIHSILIARNGYLVYEEYFGGSNANDAHMLQSVSKSFTSALIGIAIERGAITGVDEHIVDFFPERRDALSAYPQRAVMRVEDLLTMRSGTDYHERGPNSPHSQLNRLNRGWTEFILGRPMVKPPGSFFQYDSGGVILLSSLLHARTGLHADAYAEQYLFKPLGIDTFDWYKNRDGHPHTGGGLNLRARDMLKFGLLYLRRGLWDRTQVVPAEWVDASFTQHVSFTPARANRSVGYGYLWWILPPSPSGGGGENIYAAMGFRGQFIFVVPEHDIVVAVTAGTNRYTDEIRPIEFLYSHILRGVTN